MSSRPRVVIALPNVVECGMVAEWLANEGFEPVPCTTARTAAEEMRVRRFDLLVTDAGFARRDGLLAAGRRLNASTPSVVIGAIGPGEAPDAERRHTIALDRPLDRSMVICTISMALLDGRPVRRSIRKLAHRFATVVNGVPSRLIDVSNEGLRLEIPRGRLAIPPPYFSLKVPFVGVDVTVQRMWARSGPDRGSSQVTWCGGALTKNRPNAERAWRVFVEMIPIVGGNAETSLQIR
jgi:hypothetical protein